MRHLSRHSAWVPVWLVLLAGCSATPALRDLESTAAVAPPERAVGSTWPVSTDQYRTTAGTIYLDNLDARIAELQRVAGAPGGDAARVPLARNLYHRYRVVGRLEDAESALRELDLAAATGATPAESQALRAVVLGGFHRFDEAMLALDRAIDAGASESTVARTRTELQLARGDYAALADEFARSTELDADFHTMAHRADLRLQLGDPAGALFRYRAAQGLYRDVNPVPLAWLHVQQGIALLRLDRVEEAREFFAAAHARLPQYYLATEHLAECEARLGRFDAARRLYRAVIAQTGNPEFVAALAALERDAGQHEQSERLQREAESGYAALIARHPAAFGQHAAEFLIERGQPDRADALARANLDVRRDIGSWLLAAQTAAAVGDAERACAALAAARATALRPPELTSQSAALRDCS
jgi:tetratricopeptide (TPR) repeat protein